MSDSEQFPITSGLVSEFDYRQTTGSTNVDLVEVASERGDFAVVASLDQTAGRGRLDRQWSSPAGESLAASVLLRTRTAAGHPLPIDSWGWYPLIGGAALRQAVADLLPEAHVTLKWPNDVQVSGRKISGILADLVTVDGVPDSVVLGTGINLTIPTDRLPTPTSTSLVVEGANGSALHLADAVFGAYLIHLRRLVGLLAKGEPDGIEAVRQEVTAACDTLGRHVRVELPDGILLEGVAEGLDGAGRLVVLSNDSHDPLTIAAGDVTHLRYE
ncbi:MULTISPECIES: biotin--[acetyl-CoA-carboxylase] ligase [unclassified Frondihabitans]|uniref:biotin--[acetyl-CoA-carboxylase] ligase n=1 Tax=unclassified Frondihabitans TaxID=2626248 RepID=UPI000F50E1AE|nr:MULTISPECIES: biotin--[acetyl-CoA-carboxylase] ligase [unclassified Frondihabitans]RPE79030.1 BirA family biotin operon repressor/biotin-[acetyl-CoA-carboxylase] ligase [Frondihabitans sp. PhB153]RPF09310.1 BirA family biotin operon repressor/biotin-[acetyl-CoA-carboxylase] ligase [Frondihabitans sp. PhB161]